LSGRYVFDQDSFESTLASWRQLEADLKTDEAQARRLVATKPPGDEPASLRMTFRVQMSGNSFLQHNTSMQVFVRGFIENLENARNQYLGQEQSTTDTFEKGSR
jgi:hypothetical protein